MDDIKEVLDDGDVIDVDLEISKNPNLGELIGRKNQKRCDEQALVVAKLFLRFVDH